MAYMDVGLPNSMVPEAGEDNQRPRSADKGLTFDAASMRVGWG